jgi:hypothetical protein
MTNILTLNPNYLRHSSKVKRGRLNPTCRDLLTRVLSCRPRRDDDGLRTGLPNKVLFQNYLITLVLPVLRFSFCTKSGFSTPHKPLNLSRSADGAAVSSTLTALDPPLPLNQ